MDYVLDILHYNTLASGSIFPSLLFLIGIEVFIIYPTRNKLTVNRAYPPTSTTGIGGANSTGSGVKAALFVLASITKA